MERPKARQYIRDLILFRARQVTPLLFAAWERFSPDDFVRVLKLAGVVSFRYLVSRRNPNTLERVYPEAAKAVLDGQANRPGTVFTRLRPIHVDDGAFESSFAEYSINAGGRKKLLKYILCRLEEDAGGIARDPEAEPASIEHILPQNPTGEWMEAFSPPEQEAAINRIGNTALLESVVNRDIGGAAYAEKRPAYERSASVCASSASKMPLRYFPAGDNRPAATRIRDDACRAASMTALSSSPTIAPSSIRIRPSTMTVRTSVDFAL